MLHSALIAEKPDVPARRAAIHAALGRVMPAARLITSRDGCAVYGGEALAASRALPLAVALPVSTDEVAALMRVCGAAGVRVVARGAGTSLTGGTMPAPDAVVVCLSRMSRIIDLSTTDCTIGVEAGTSLLVVERAAAAAGLRYTPDPASGAACTIGGTIATNAVGMHSLGHGATAHSLLAATVVLASGDILRLGGDTPATDGYDLLGIVCGSEGQLGIVTEATLRLRHIAYGARSIALGFPDETTAMACTAAIMAERLMPTAVDFLDEAALAACPAPLVGLIPPAGNGVLFVDTEGTAEQAGDVAAQIEAIAGRFAGVVLRMAVDRDAAAWQQARQAGFTAIGRASDYHCVDGSAPAGALAVLLPRIPAICEARGLKVAVFAQAAEGYVRALIRFNANDPVQTERAQECGDDIARLCVDAGGALSGAHGVGIVRRDQMTEQCTPAELAQQMAIKLAFDPGWQLNAGKMFPLAIARDLLGHAR